MEQKLKLFDQETHRDSLQENSEFEVDLNDFLVLTLDNDRKNEHYKGYKGYHRRANWNCI